MAFEDISTYATKAELETLESDTEIVAARAVSTSGQTFPNNSTDVVIWSSETYDTHSALNIATGEFIVPSGMEGYYEIKSRVRIPNGGAVSTIRLMVYNNGTATNQGTIITTSASTDWPISVQDTLFLAAGDVVDIRLNQQTGATRALTTVPIENNFSITRIGN
jgi:hypothetical protein